MLSSVILDEDATNISLTVMVVKNQVYVRNTKNEKCTSVVLYWYKFILISLQLSLGISCMGMDLKTEVFVIFFKKLFEALPEIFLRKLDS